MSREFMRLQKEWYGKLKREGFEDIEQVGIDGAPLPLLLSDCRIDPERHPHVMGPTTEYFSQAAEFLHRGKLTGLDRRVWRAHVDGSSMRDISRVEGISLKRAWTIVNDLQARMGAWREATAAQREAEHRNPVGRPRYEERGAVRSSRVQAIVTVEEFAVLRQAAEMAGARSVSTWARNALIDSAREIAAKNYVNQKTRAA